jgi:hypothetical protein
MYLSGHKHDFLTIIFIKFNLNLHWLKKLFLARQEPEPHRNFYPESEPHSTNNAAPTILLVIFRLVL